MSILVIMTALPPTVGHQYLLDFSVEFAALKNEKLEVIVCTQPSEPMSGERFGAIRDYMRKYERSHFYEVRDLYKEMAQAPTGPDDTAFWTLWRDELYQYTDDRISHVISSESYGYQLASVLDAKHIPCDPSRAIFDVKATKVRDGLQGIEYILPEFRRYLQKHVVMFGADSCGKSTLARLMKDAFFNQKNLHAPEWARTYLEGLSDKTVTAEIMEDIASGQSTQEMTLLFNNGSHRFVFYDTDILTTLGYYRLYFPEYESLRGYRNLVRMMEDKYIYPRKDLYIVCPSNIPFKPDPLRYGGDKRESTDDFWIKLLEEFKCPYEVLKSADRQVRVDETRRIVTKLYNSNPIWGFKR